MLFRTVLPPENAPARFTHWTFDKLRYGDTDKLGHVNNAVFSTFLETGRVDLLCREEELYDAGTAYVIVRLVLDYKSEINWPGEVKIGSRIMEIGRSSLKLEQVVMQGDTITALAETTLVQMDMAARKSRPFSDDMRAKLAALQGDGGA